MSFAPFIVPTPALHEAVQAMKAEGRQENCMTAWYTRSTTGKLILLMGESGRQCGSRRQIKGGQDHLVQATLKGRVILCVHVQRGSKGQVQKAVEDRKRP